MWCVQAFARSRGGLCLACRPLRCVPMLFPAGSHCKSACALISGVTTVRPVPMLGSAGRITVAMGGGGCFHAVTADPLEAPLRE